MTEVTDRYARIVEGFTARINGCPPGAWGSPSPCEDWSAADVVRHVVDTHRRMLTRLSGGDPTPPDSDEDLPAAWRVESAAVLAALTDPERAATHIDGMGGRQPFEDVAGTLLCADTLIHTWDLARATGQDERLDAPAVTAATTFLEPNDAMLRRPGGFAPAVEAPSDADEQTRFLCFVGRRP